MGLGLSLQGSHARVHPSGVLGFALVAPNMVRLTADEWYPAVVTGMGKKGMAWTRTHPWESLSPSLTEQMGEQGRKNGSEGRTLGDTSPLFGD